MLGLEFYNLRAEMQPSQCAYALVCATCHLGAVPVYILGLTCKRSGHAELSIENKGSFPGSFGLSSSNA
jgi:hypothetical protein